ncbi:1491_t:CDS:2, partial [Acaulospora colombiana]
DPRGEGLSLSEGTCQLSTERGVQTPVIADLIFSDTVYLELHSTGETLDIVFRQGYHCQVIVVR